MCVHMHEHVCSHALGKHWMLWGEEEVVEVRSSVQCEGRVLKGGKKRGREGSGRERENEREKENKIR